MKIYIGYDTRQPDAFKVARQSTLDHNPDLDVEGIYLSACRDDGLYTRPTSERNGHLFDDISGAPMSTEFAITRFLTPELAKNSGEQWALFMDSDMLVRTDLEEMLKEADPRYAVMCVMHDVDHGAPIKMDGCTQTEYGRKNWSSVMLWNLDHPSNDCLTLEMINSRRGLHLHQFCWLKGCEIGGLDPRWNHLIGLYPEDEEAKIAHYTLGTPDMPGYEDSEHADEWWEVLNKTIT